MAARCFELLEEGKTIREIVIELREDPEKIEMLREKWLNYGGAELVINEAAQKALETLLWPFKGVTELVELVCGLAPSVRPDRKSATKK